MATVAGDAGGSWLLRCREPCDTHRERSIPASARASDRAGRRLRVVQRQRALRSARRAHGAALRCLRCKRCRWRRAPGSSRRPVLAFLAPSTMKILPCCAAVITMLSMSICTAAAARTGYLGPAGSWTHQACLELFAEEELVALERETLFEALRAGTIERACVPVTTSVVGATPYLDDVLALDAIAGVQVVAEYPKVLGYSLLAKPGTRREDIRTIVAHPVALEEVKPWLDREMPHVERRPAASAGAAAKLVAQASRSDMAAMGPPSAARIHALASVADGIEQGPHNTTRWWVLGRVMPAPSGRDKTSLLLSVDEAGFQRSLQALTGAARVLAIYERPGRKSLDGHRYVIDIVGHASQPAIAGLLAQHREFRLLGSYPRRY